MNHESERGATTPTAPANGPATRPPRMAATVVLLRDGADGLHVLMTRRSGGAGLMAGATVFPGGKVDADDANLGPWPNTAIEGVAAAQGRDAASVAAAFGAAVRELCEEAAIVLAHRDGAEPAEVQPLAAEVAQAIAAAVHAEREGHRVTADAFARALRIRGLQATLAEVVPFAWWVTPAAEPVRFDTLFFAAILPPGQVAAADGVEGVWAGWLRPMDALATHERGGPVVLPPPTLHTLERLVALGASDASGASAVDIVAALQSGGLGPRMQPHFLAETPDGPIIALADDPLHPDALPSDAHRRNRFCIRGGRFVRERRDPRID